MGSCAFFSLSKVRGWALGREGIEDEEVGAGGDIEDKQGILCHQKTRLAKFELQKAFIKMNGRLKILSQ